MRSHPLIFAILYAFAPSRAAAGPVENAAKLLEQWRIEEAAAAVNELRDKRPDAPEVLYLDGRIKFEQGDYAGAVKRLDEAIAVAPPAWAIGWRELRDLVAATDAATHNFIEARSPEGHFIVKHAPRDAVLLPYAFSALEAARREIAERDFGGGANTGALLGEPVRVEIYPEVADLAKVSTLTIKEIETSGTIALCKFNRLMIVSPRALVRGYPWVDTLAHEYTHYVVSRASHNTVPIWLHEGLAKFEEHRWRRGAGGGLTPTMEHLLATALNKSRRLITFEEMYPSMAKLPSQADTALAFAEVYTVVEYLHERKGWAGVRQVIERMKSGQGDARAVADVLGEGWEEFQRGWKAWLRGRHLRTHPGLVPSSLRFAKLPPGAKKGAKEKEDDDTLEIAETEARKYARLGGMLRAQGRLSAAVFEYQKAQHRLGSTNLQVSQKLARTYLELGDPRAAIAAAMPAWELYPESGGLAGVLGEAHMRLGQTAQATPFFEAALYINPFDPAPHCGLGRIYPDGDPRATRERDACRALATE